MGAPLYPVSDHCDGYHFFNPTDQITRTLLHVLVWKLSGRPQPWPKHIDLPPSPPLPQRPVQGATATWINHATFLVQTPAASILIDPVYSDRASPMSWAGPKRVHAPGIPFERLPKIDLVLLSHDHYDHCDIATLSRLAHEHAPLAITPLGNGDLLRKAGFTRIIELDWWQSLSPSAALTITLTPSRHWSNRVLGARNGRLWGGFFIMADKTSLHFVGDTGYDKKMFGDVRTRLGPPDLALVPIGAYEPRWFMEALHCNPAEAVRIHQDLGARTSVAMHWGTFQLTDEAREAPLDALKKARENQGISAENFVTLMPGESINVAPLPANRTTAAVTEQGSPQ